MHRHCGLGAIKALELKAKEAQIQHNKNEAATIAYMALQVVDDLEYLNGCVKRGRGEVIDPVHPGRNVFEYIKELESIRAVLADIRGDLANYHQTDDDRISVVMSKIDACFG